MAGRTRRARVVLGVIALAVIVLGVWAWESAWMLISTRRVPIEEGIELFRGMRGRTSGFAIPQYVLDTPHGKVPLDYPFARGRDGDDFVVEAWDGTIWREPNPLREKGRDEG